MEKLSSPEKPSTSNTTSVLDSKELSAIDDTADSKSHLEVTQHTGNPDDLSLDKATIEDESSVRKRLVSHIVAQPNAFIRHQQRGEADIDTSERYDIVDRLLTEKPFDFLKRL